MLARSGYSGVTVLDYVLTVIRRTHGGIDFSFAVLDPGDPESAEAEDPAA